MTIRARLLLLVLSSLLPAAAAALWLVGQTYNAERRAHERTLRDTTRALAMVVGRELEQRATIASVLALSRSLDAAPDLPPEAQAQFEQLARRATSELQGWVELGTGGRVVLSTALGAAAPGSAPAGAAAPDGAAGAEELVDVPVVRPLTRGPGGVLRARLVQPVQREGSTRLNLAVTILPAELQQIIDEQRLPPDWVAAVLDNDGTVVARHPGGLAYAGRAATPDMKQHLAASREAVFDSVTLDGVAVSGYFSTSPQGWTYLTAMPRAQLGGLVPRAVAEAGLAALLLLGLTIAATLWVARRIALPVQSLKRAAVDLKAGRAVALAPTGIVECDDVAAALADAAAATQRAQAELERQVHEAVARTRAAEQRVSHSQKVEALGRLTGGVAHDFNNLLGVISNSAHLIDRHAADRPELKVPVAATLRAVEVGSRLTQHLVRFAGRQPVRPQALDLARYLGDTQELLQTVLGKRVELTVAVAPATHAITVDSSELELALINLALNARDAMPKGGHVWLRARDADEHDAAGLPPRRYVLITVTDDGSGVDEALAERAFEPFFTTKPMGKGTGLGLSQVHGFCVQAGGTARLASTPGLGTTVSLLLPASHDAAGGVPAPAPATPAAAAAGMRVLLVEDNEALGDVTAALLDAFQCRVRRAGRPEEALRLLDEGAEFDVVLSDVVMPGDMDGLALARLLRQRHPQLPVVLISGYNAVPAAAGEFILLGKPCTPQELLTALIQATSDTPGGAREGR